MRVCKCLCVCVCVQLSCQFDATCLNAVDVSQRFHMDIAMAASVALGCLPTMLVMILIPTYLRDQLQSHELRSLIFHVSAARLRKPESYW